MRSLNLARVRGVSYNDREIISKVGKTMIPYKNNTPKINRDAFIAMYAIVAGRVTLEKNVGIWFGAVLRGDVSHIHVGEGTNIQDNATIHVGHDVPTIIGKHVTVGHNCIIHGCTINDNVIVGMGSTVLDGAVIGRNSIVGANSLVTMNKTFPEGVLIMGSPAKVIRELTEQEIESIETSATEYMKLAKAYQN